MGAIYCYTNPINGRKYIGLTTNEEERKKGHIFFSLHPDKSSNDLYLDMHTIGFHNFKYEVLEYVNVGTKDVEDKLLNEKEKYYISLYKSNIPEFGYNKSKGGGYSRNKHPMWMLAFNK